MSKGIISFNPLFEMLFLLKINIFTQSAKILTLIKHQKMGM